MSNKASAKVGAAGKGKKASAKAGSGEQKTEDSLQAVIIADSFEDRFKPFTLETPRCLLPLANIPLIEYTLEFLAMSGVQEVFIYCASHEDKIEAYIQDSPRWSPKTGLSPFSSFEFIRVSDATSIGDFLRDLDKRALINGDFLLVHGDLVANIPMDGALARHRARREKNRDACMTLMLRAGGEEQHRTKVNGIDPVFVLNAATGQCVHYEEIHPLQENHSMALDFSALDKSHTDIDLRSDLIDCGIDICTPDVLALWSESFDYELPRRNFLHGVLKDWELSGKMIHAEILEDGYAARAANLQLYDSISHDVLGRWTYPLVPDSNIVQGSSYKIARTGAILEDDVSIGAGCKLNRCVVGKGSVFGDGSVVLNSTIGRGCKLGRNVNITNSYIWDNVTIADGTEISQSILASSVVVGKECKIPDGTLLSFGVHLSDNVSLPQTQVSISLRGHDGRAIPDDHSAVGAAGKGAYYEEPDAEDVEDEDNVDPGVLHRSLIYSLAGLNISQSSISTLASEGSDDEDDDDDIGSHAESFLSGDITHRERLSSFASDDSAEKTGAFHQDAVHGLYDALRADNTDDFDSAKLEFMGLRLSNNASDHAMQKAIAMAFAMRAAELAGGEHGLEPSKAAEKALTSKRGAVKFIREVGLGDEDISSQVDFTIAVQKALLGIKGLETARAGNIMAAMLQQFYNLDVLEEDGILSWWADKRASATSSMNTIREKCRVLVEWLENAEEDDSDDEE